MDWRGLRRTAKTTDPDLPIMVSLVLNLFDVTSSSPSSGIRLVETFSSFCLHPASIFASLFLPPFLHTLHVLSKTPG